MTQGNPFGRGASPWMPEWKLRMAFADGLTYDEIAVMNERAEGWRPHRSVVKRKYEALGMPARHQSHTDLIPRGLVKPEHRDHIFRHMLEAESKQRKGKDLTAYDRKMLDRMHDLLYGRGQLMVIGYHPDIGWYTATREEGDEDIFRRPRTDVYAQAGIKAQVP